jgi:DNA polymerase III delta prime subunit
MENLNETGNSLNVETEDVVSNSSADIVRDFFNVGRVKKLFRMGTDIFSAVSPFVEKRTLLSGVQAAFEVGKIFVDDLEVWHDNFFDDRWDNPYPFSFNKVVIKALSNKSFKVIKTSDEGITIRKIKIEDVTFGYVFNSKTNEPGIIYVEIEKIPKAKEIIKKELWRTMKGKNIVLRNVKRPSNRDVDALVLEADDAFRSIPSKMSHEYSVYLQKCIAASVPRSVMLYGPPGTGKSTMARTIVENLGMKSFRIRVEDIGDIETSTIFEAINIFEPDAVIFDDFDRSNSQESLLEILEFFQRHVKLVLATVNNKSHLDEAILRPGRFDELIQVKQMDSEVIKSMLGEANIDAYDIVKDWPIAFIQEYVKRLRFMSPEEAKDSVKELAKRVDRLKKYDDDDSSD